MKVSISFCDEVQIVVIPRLEDKAQIRKCFYMHHEIAEFRNAFNLERVLLKDSKKRPNDNNVVEDFVPPNNSSPRKADRPPTKPHRKLSSSPKRSSTAALAKFKAKNRPGQKSPMTYLESIGLPICVKSEELDTEGSTHDDFAPPPRTKATTLPTVILAETGHNSTPTITTEPVRATTASVNGGVLEMEVETPPQSPELSTSTAVPDIMAISNIDDSSISQMMIAQPPLYRRPKEVFSVDARATNHPLRDRLTKRRREKRTEKEQIATQDSSSLFSIYTSYGGSIRNARLPIQSSREWWLVATL